MITEKIRNLFQFIEFLHSNIENFKRYDGVIQEYQTLKEKRNELRPHQNYKERLEYNKIQAELESKIKIIQENITWPITDKVAELGICNPNKEETLWNWNISEINSLQKNLDENDIPEIFEQKSRYLEYRTKTSCTYFMDLFFDYSDRVFRELFDFFKETEQNEFELFEAKAIQVNDIGEAVKLFRQGRKSPFPLDFLNSAKVQQRSNTEALPPQPIAKQQTKLTINQIALKHVYGELQITRENSNEIVKQYGHNSGEKLFQRFTYYSSPANRKGRPAPCTPKKLDNKIKLIESVIDLLSVDKQGRARDEVLILKEIQEAEFK